MSQKSTQPQTVPTLLKQTPTQQNRPEAQPSSVAAPKPERNPKTCHVHFLDNPVETQPETRLKALDQMYHRIAKGKSGVVLSQGLMQIRYYVAYLHSRHKRINSVSDGELKREGENQGSGRVERHLMAEPNIKISGTSTTSIPLTNQEPEIVALSDLNQCLKTSPRFLDNNIEPYLDVIYEDMLATWIKKPESARLLIFDLPEEHSRVMPILCFLIYSSAIGAGLGNLKNRVDGIFPMAFFWSAYNQKKEPEDGVSIMYKSLIAQLSASGYDFNLNKMRQYPDNQAYEGNWHHLALFLSDLLAQFPRKMLVLCMIEGIDYYDGQNDDTIFRCVHHLTELSRNSDVMKADFKLLVTSKPGYQTVKRLTEPGGLYEHNTMSTKRQ